MTQITVKVEAGRLESTIKRAALAVERLPKHVLKREIEIAKEQARKYPPELPGQRYVRTGTYYRSFRIISLARGYRLESDARQRGRRYTRWVGGLADGSSQARIHAGRWTLIHQAMQAAIERIRQRAREYFVDVLLKNGAP